MLAGQLSMPLTALMPARKLTASAVPVRGREHTADDREHGRQGEQAGEHAGPDEQRLVLPVQERRR